MCTASGDLGHRWHLRRWHCSPPGAATTTPRRARPPPTAGGSSGTGTKVGLVFDIDRARRQVVQRFGRRRASTRRVDELGVETEGPHARRPAARTARSSSACSPTDGYQLVFAVGFLFGDSVTAVAKAKTRTRSYAIIDSVVDAPNVTSLTFAEEQGSYLVGAAAALKSKTGKIGFIGGVNTPLIKKFEAGLRGRVRRRSTPTSRSQIKYLTEPPDFTGFSDPAKGRRSGARHVRRRRRRRVPRGRRFRRSACSRPRSRRPRGGTKVWAIGVDSDQYESIGDPTLAAVHPHVDGEEGERRRLRHDQGFVDGSLARGTVKVFDLEYGRRRLLDVGRIRRRHRDAARRPQAADHRRRDHGPDHPVGRDVERGPGPFWGPRSRPSSSSGSPSGSRASSPTTTSRSESSRARSTRSSARTAPASRR